jgi:hypothetical protein
MRKNMRSFRPKTKHHFCFFLKFLRGKKKCGERDFKMRNSTSRSSSSPTDANGMMVTPYRAAIRTNSAFSGQKSLYVSPFKNKTQHNTCTSITISKELGSPPPSDYIP